MPWETWIARRRDGRVLLSKALQEGTRMRAYLHSALPRELRPGIERSANVLLDLLASCGATTVRYNRCSAV